MATVQVPTMVALPIPMFSELNLRGGGSVVAASRFAGTTRAIFFFFLFLPCLPRPSLLVPVVDALAPPLPLQVPPAIAFAWF